jgi:YidC/Oxa1 family membrane protein insertase
MDRRTTFALILCLAVFALFTALQSRYAPKPSPRAVRGPAVDSLAAGAPPESAAAPAPVAAVAPGATNAPARPAAIAASPTPSVPRSEHVIETPLYRATFSNIGARLEHVELKRYAAAWGRSRYAENPGRRPKRGHDVPEGDRVAFRGAPSFAFDLVEGGARRSLADTPFAVEESTDASGAVAALTFTARDSNGMAIRQTWRARPGDHLLELEVSVAGAPPAVRDWSLTARSWPLMNESNLDQESRSVRAISLVGGNLHRDGAQGLIGKSEKLREGAVRWAGVQSHYFLGVVTPLGAEGRLAVGRGVSYTATAAELALLPPNSKPSQPIAEGSLVLAAPASGSQRFGVYFGPADYFSLAKISGAGKAGSLQLEKAVDLGMTWMLPFSYPLLQLLRLFDSWVRNFGIAILLLATLVRIVLHPLNMSSMKSMRALQKLQPEMERVREKYKNKPEAMNAAIMALYKENKVNPAGGCLPMLLQMPLFFALYAVLFNAIDLRQAPFVGFIHDLSSPDHLFSVAGVPIRLLPIIMTGTGFLQQKLTPTPPQQATTMYLMNLFMLFIFYGLPSGLVFYWTVMNLYTALQQWLAMRGDDKVVVVAGGPPVKGQSGKPGHGKGAGR